MTLFTLLLTLLACLLSLPSVAGTFSYVGCYPDRLAGPDRDLGAMVAMENEFMTPVKCESICWNERHQYKYFGVQFGGECWCGNSYGRWGGPAPEEHCGKPCVGSKVSGCGGPLHNSVYEITTPPPLPPPNPSPSAHRPLIGLVAIVKDEAHSLPTTLLSFKPWIDVYYFLDTGSTDGTQEVIRKTLGPKGEVHQGPFNNYGDARNRALALAKNTTTLGGPPIFSLMISADETLINGDGLRQFCEEHRDRKGNGEEGYWINMDHIGTIKYLVARLSRTDAGWVYYGKVHEFLAPPNRIVDPEIATIRFQVPKTLIKLEPTDVERRSTREQKFVEILEGEIRENPNDTRSMFYLARAHIVLKNFTEAIRVYEQRIAMGGWHEEIQEAYMGIGMMKTTMGYPWPERMEAYLKAHEWNPQRAEPLYEIAYYYMNQSIPSLAYAFGHRCVQIPYPTNAPLWVESEVYTWKCHYIVGKHGYMLDQYEVGLRSALKAHKVYPRDPAILEWFPKYREKMTPQDYAKIECEVIPERCDTQNLSTGGQTIQTQTVQSGEAQTQEKKEISIPTPSPAAPASSSSSLPSDSSTPSSPSFPSASSTTVSTPTVQSQSSSSTSSSSSSSAAAAAASVSSPSSFLSPSVLLILILLSLAAQVSFFVYTWRTIEKRWKRIETILRIRQQQSTIQQLIQTNNPIPQPSSPQPQRHKHGKSK